MFITSYIKEAFNIASHSQIKCLFCEIYPGLHVEISPLIHETSLVLMNSVNYLNTCVIYTYDIMKFDTGVFRCEVE